MGDGDLFDLVVSVDEAVETIQLVHIPVAQPLLHPRQLRADRPLLVSVHPLDLDVALLPQVVDDRIDGVVIYCLQHTAVCLGRHVGESLGDVVVVYTVFDEGIGNEELFYSLSLCLFGRYFFDPSRLARGKYLNVISQDYWEGVVLYFR